MLVVLAILDVSGDVAVTVLGAVGVAVFTGYLTAHTTNGRLDKQLAHERKLEAKAELRDALDDCAAALLAMARRMTNAKVHVTAAYQLRDEAAASPPMKAHLRKELRASLSRFDNGVADLIPIVGRLQLRLSSEHAVVTRLGRYFEQANEIGRQLPSVLPVTQDDVSNAETAQDFLADEAQHWIDDAYKLVGAAEDLADYRADD